MRKLLLLLAGNLLALAAAGQDYVDDYKKMVRHYDAGQYEYAAEAGQKALAGAEQTVGRVSDDYLVILRDLGTIFSELEDYETAYRYLTEAVGIYPQLYPDSLDFEFVMITNDAGLAAFNAGNWRAAGQYYLRALHLLEALDMTATDDYTVVLQNLVLVSEELPHTDEKMAYLQDYLQRLETSGNTADDTYFDALYQAAVAAAARGEEDLAADYYRKALQAAYPGSEEYFVILQKIITLYDPNEQPAKALRPAYRYYHGLLAADWAESTFKGVAANWLALCYNNLERYDSAIYYYRQALTHLEADSANRLVVALNLSETLEEAGATEALLQNDSLVVELARQQYPTGSPDLYLTLNSAGMDAYQQKHYRTAIGWFREALDHCRNDPENYSIILNNLGMAYIEGHFFAEGEKTLEEILDLSRQRQETNPEAYILDLNNLGLTKLELSKYDEARQYLEEARRLLESRGNTDNTTYYTVIDNLARVYTDIGQHEVAEKLLLESARAGYRLSGPQSKDYLIPLSNLAKLYASMGRFELAEKAGKEALAIALKHYPDSEILANIAHILGSIYTSTGRYKMAVIMYKEAIGLDKKLSGESSLPYAEDLNSIGTLMFYLGDYARAEEYLKKAWQIKSGILGPASATNVIVMQNLGTVLIYLNKYEEAETLLQQCLELQETLGWEEHAGYGTTLNITGFLYYRQHDFGRAAAFFARAYKHYSAREDVNMDAGNAAFNLAVMFTVENKPEEAETYFAAALAVLKTELLRTLPYLSEADKEKYYRSIRSRIQAYYNFARQRLAERPALSRDILDMQLLTKGILFASVNQMREAVLNSGDSSLLADFNRWQHLKRQAIRWQQEGNPAGLDSLEIIVNEMEKQLTEKASFLNLNRMLTKAGWQDIRQALQPGEAAIEIVSVPGFDFRNNAFSEGGKFYLILAVTPSTTEFPATAVIADGAALDNKYFTYYKNSIRFQRQDTRSYRHFWEPILNTLPDGGEVKKVYLSVDGVFNKISFNTLLNPATGNYLLDETEVVRVSNLQDILHKPADPAPPDGRKAVLLGFPQYALQDEAADTSDTLTFNPYEIFRQDTATRFLSNGVVTSLPGTRTEVEQISTLLREKGLPAEVYTGRRAREEILKSLRGPYILHIATHGYFRPDPEQKGLQFSTMAAGRSQSGLLTGSGLLLAGAQNTINGQSGNSREDGILTDRESATLFLHGTELVVLSACETGLGEIRNGEGVYGLQRAFQVAGARSVMMSLWTVDDAATQQMMTLFYKNWLQGQSKREAFRQAQKQLRKAYPHPYYWGAFVMLGK